MNVTQGLERSRQQFGNRAATIFDGRSRSWSELHDRVTRIATGLKEMGAKPGDRIALFGANSDGYLEAYYAIAWAGCVSVPGNTRWATAEHVLALKETEPAIVIADADFAEVAHVALGVPSHQIVRMSTDNGPGRSTESFMTNTPSDNEHDSGGELAGIFYTGGTTGRPKGVMLSHDGLITNYFAMMMVSPLPEDAVFLHSAPMFHMMDATFLFGSSFLGATHVIVPNFRPEAVAASIVNQGVNSLILAPTMIGMLDQYLREHPADLSGVLSLKYGASPISESLLQRTIEIFPRAHISQGYGQTELSPVATMLLDAEHRCGGPVLRSAGRAIPGVDIEIRDDAQSRCMHGAIGEVWVRSPGVMLGYWRQPELTSETIREGWLKTGDAGYMTEDGYLFLVDRIKDMIVSGGENVYSAEVENALSKHPTILECAVIGLPDDKWGERVHAIVRFRPRMAASAEELNDHCAALIARYKRPRSYEIRVEPFPLSGAGKVLKRELRASSTGSDSRAVMADSTSLS